MGPLKSHRKVSLKKHRLKTLRNSRYATSIASIERVLLRAYSLMVFAKESFQTFGRKEINNLLSR